MALIAADLVSAANGLKVYGTQPVPATPVEALPRLLGTVFGLPASSRVAVSPAVSSLAWNGTLHDVRVEAADESVVMRALVARFVVGDELCIMWSLLPEDEIGRARERRRGESFFAQATPIWPATRSLKQLLALPATWP